MSLPISLVTTDVLLGLVAGVAVASTVLSYVALLWVTRRRKGLPDFTPPVTVLKPLKNNRFTVVAEGPAEQLQPYLG